MRSSKLERLKSVVAYCYNNSKFYHDRLEKAGVGDGSRIKQLSDIQYIPYTTKIFQRALSLWNGVFADEGRGQNTRFRRHNG